MKPFSKLSPNESVFGLIYYLLQLLIVPGMLVVVDIMFLRDVISEVMVNFLFFVINFVVVLIIFRKFLLADLRYAIAHPWYVLRCAGIGFLIYMAGNVIINLVIVLTDPGFANINDATIMEMVQDNFSLMTISTVLLVPIAEESFYRVLIFRNLYDRSPVIAYAVSMVVFSLAHVLAYVGYESFGTLMLCFLQYLPAGFALAWSYRRSGSIFASVLIHMTVNQIGMLAMR